MIYRACCEHTAGMTTDDQAWYGLDETGIQRANEVADVHGVDVREFRDVRRAFNKDVVEAISHTGERFLACGLCVHKLKRSRR